MVKRGKVSKRKCYHEKKHEDIWREKIKINSCDDDGEEADGNVNDENMIHVGRMTVKALWEMTIDLSGDLVGDFQAQRARPLTQLSNYRNATEGKILR